MKNVWICGSIVGLILVTMTTLRFAFGFSNDDAIFCAVGLWVLVGFSMLVAYAITL